MKTNKLSEEDAKEVLIEAKADNWKGLLEDGKLGILAAIRNIRNVLINRPDTNTIDKLCSSLSNKEMILKGKIMPYHFDLANEVLISEFNDVNSRKVSKALLEGYESGLPNLKELLSGNNLVIIVS